MTDSHLPPANQIDGSSKAFHIWAWLGILICIGEFMLMAISAAGAPGPNHQAQFWNSMLTWTPIMGAVVAIIAITRSLSWVGRIFAGIPLLGYLAAAAYMISWNLKH